MCFDQMGKMWQEIFQQCGKGFSSLTILYLFGLLHKGKGKAVETLLEEMSLQDFKKSY